MKIARTTAEYKTGLKNPNIDKMFFPGSNNMTMKGMKTPVKYYGVTEGEITDEGVAFPGEDFKVKGDSTMEFRLNNRNMNPYFNNSLPWLQDGGDTKKADSKGSKKDPKKNPPAKPNPVLAKLVGKDKPFKDIKSLQQAVNAFNELNGTEVTPIKEDNIAGKNTIKAITDAVQKGAFYRDLGRDFNYDEIPIQYQDNRFLFGKDANKLGNLEEMLYNYNETLDKMSEDMPAFIKENVGEGKEFRDVKELQSMINQAGNDLAKTGMMPDFKPLEVDGNFGPVSQNTIKSMKQAVDVATSASDIEARNKLGMELDEYEETQPSNMAEAILDPAKAALEPLGPQLAQGKEDQDNLRSRFDQILMDKLQVDSPQAAAMLLSNLNLAADPNDPNADLNGQVDAVLGSSVGQQVKAAVEQLQQEIGGDINDPYFKSVVESTLGNLGTSPEALQTLSTSYQNQTFRPQSVPGAAPRGNNNQEQPFDENGQPSPDLIPEENPQYYQGNQNQAPPVRQLVEPNNNIRVPGGPEAPQTIGGVYQDPNYYEPQDGQGSNVTPTPAPSTQSDGTTTPDNAAPKGAQEEEDAAVDAENVAEAAVDDAVAAGENPDGKKFTRNGNVFELSEQKDGTYAVVPVGQGPAQMGENMVGGNMAQGRNTRGTVDIPDGTNKKPSIKDQLGFRPMRTGWRALDNRINNYRADRAGRRRSNREQRDEYSEADNLRLQSRSEEAYYNSKYKNIGKGNDARRNASDQNLSTTQARNAYELAQMESDNEYGLYDQGRRHKIDQANEQTGEQKRANQKAYGLNSQAVANLAEIEANDMRTQQSYRTARTVGRAQGNWEESNRRYSQDASNAPNRAANAQQQGYREEGYDDTPVVYGNLPVQTQRDMKNGRKQYKYGGLSLPKHRIQAW